MSVVNVFYSEPVKKDLIILDTLDSSWRDANYSYVNYSNIAAKTLRRSLKSTLKDEASKRDESLIKCYFWMNGEILPLGKKPAGDEKDKT